MGRINGRTEGSDGVEAFSMSNEGRDLLLYNVPAFLTKGLIGDVFERFGTIKEIIFGNSDHRIGGLHAGGPVGAAENSWVYIVFFEEESIQRIRCESIKKCAGSIRSLYIDGSESGFLDRGDFRFKHVLMRTTHKRVNSAALQKEVDSYMTNYDVEREIEEENLKLESTVPDEDGFIKVVNRRQKAPDGTVVHSFEPEKSHGFKAKKQINKKEKKKTYSDFYRFQIRENKKREIQKLNYQ
ncbi:hypothetical protein OJ253_3449 [Cryptosporidium canis]|uniref:Ribosomal RNA-processing protein 7 C-terminal domain-containing protein n=1 Tax=Cryptosporidium canis TaxID=195482 RepID=A0A9D5DJQ6_9CRYT|nr:hypothetical protein OJ253_3449 [Cryptosporidium canis]